MARFLWDNENRAHLAGHGVTPDEFEQAYASRGILRQTLTGERRKMASGVTEAGRVLVIVYTVRRGLVRAITAYESRKARRQWQG